MAARTDKALLLFSTGEVTPLLAGRTDIERVSGACRTLQNMLVDTAGPVERRPGLQYVAQSPGSALGACPDLGRQWYERVLANGGTANARDRQIICELVAELETKDYYNNGYVWLLLPLVGRDLPAGLTWLVNSLRDNGAGADGSLNIYANTSTGSNFDPEIGLFGMSDTVFPYMGLGTMSQALAGKGANQPAFGYWENAASLTGVQRGRFGQEDARQFGGAGFPVANLENFYVSPTEVRGRCGDQNDVTPDDPGSPGNWSISRAYQPGLYQWKWTRGVSGQIIHNGVEILRDTTVSNQNFGLHVRWPLMGTGFVSFGASELVETPESVFGANGSRLGCFYIVDGPNFTDADALDFYTVLRDFLMVPTERI